MELTLDMCISNPSPLHTKLLCHPSRSFSSRPVPRDFRVCVRTSVVPTGLGHFSHSTQRCRAGLSLAAPTELDIGASHSTSLVKTEFSHRLFRARLSHPAASRLERSFPHLQASGRVS